MANDRQRNAAQKQAFNSGISMRTHDDQVSRPLFGFDDNFRPSIALTHYCLSPDPFLLQTLGSLLRQVTRAFLHLLIYALEAFESAVPWFDADRKKGLDDREYAHSRSFWPWPFGDFFRCRSGVVGIVHRQKYLHLESLRGALRS